MHERCEIESYRMLRPSLYGQGAFAGYRATLHAAGLPNGALRVRQPAPDRPLKDLADGALRLRCTGGDQAAIREFEFRLGLRTS